MSTIEELSQTPLEYVLFYCNHVQKDPMIYETNCTNVFQACINKETQCLEIKDWLLKEKYEQPSIELLLTYKKDDVLTWYKSFYQQPIDIFNAQLAYKITEEDLKDLRTEDLLIDSVVYNTTVNRLQYWNGSTWNNCFA